MPGRPTMTGTSGERLAAPAERARCYTMISNPKPGDRVQFWYATTPKRIRIDLPGAAYIRGPAPSTTMPHHGLLGTVMVAGRSRPRNHMIDVDGVGPVIVPAGNLRAPARVG